MKRCKEEQAKQIVLWGRSYKSKYEVAEKFGLDYGSIAYGTGFKKKSLEETVVALLQREPIMFEGKLYSTIVDLCSEYGVLPYNVMERLRYGKTLQEAIYMPFKDKKRGNSIFFEGKQYPSEIGLCRAYNISRALVVEQKRYAVGKDFLQCFQLIKQLKDECGWPKDKLFAYIPVFKIEGIFYKKVSEFAIKVGLTGGQISTYKSRNHCKDMIQTFQCMQRERITKYATSQGKYFYRELMRMGYQCEQIERLPCIEVPRYSGLQDYCFEKDCMDVQSRNNELFGKKDKIRGKDRNER